MASRLAKNTLYLTVASVGQKLIAFVYFLFVARIMGTEGTGMYFLALSLVTIFSVLSDVGVSPVVIREIAKNKSSALKWVRTALGTKLPFVFLSAIAAIVASVLLQYEWEIIVLVCIASIIIMIDAFSLLYYAVLRGFHALKHESIGIFLSQMTTAIIGALVLWLTPSLPMIIGALILGSTVNALYAASRVVRILGRKALVPIFDLNKSKKLLSIAFPFFLAAVFVKVYSYIDTVIISKFLDTTQVGLYSIAYKFTYAFQFLPLSFVAALYPNLSELLAGNDTQTLQKSFTNAIWYMSLLVFPIVAGIWVIADHVVLFAGADYAASAPILRVLILVLIPIFLDFPIGSLLNAANRQTTKTTIMGCTMVIAVLLNIIFVPMVGTIGAAYAAVISFSFMFIAGSCFVPVIIPGYSYLSLAKLLLPILLSAMVMWFVTWELNPHVFLPITVGVGVLTYLCSLFLFGAITKDQLSQLRFFHSRS